MSDYLQPGQHPDPDSLGAFIEGVLPEHERLQCLAHLADCAACREVVYLAQEPLAADPLPVTPVAKVRFRERWFTPVPVFSTAFGSALAIGILVLSVWLYQNHRPAGNSTDLVAMAPRAEAARGPLTYSHPAPAAPQTIKEPVQPPPLAQTPALMAAQPTFPLVALPPATQPLPQRTVAAAPAAAPSSVAVVAQAPKNSADFGVDGISPAPQPTAVLDAVRAAASPVSETGITGRITDPAGGVIAGAAVKLRLLNSSASRRLTSDRGGQFNVAGLEPGLYELQVSAPGFKEMTERVDVQPRQVARADSTLSIGSVAETVTVTAEASRVMLSTSDISAKETVQPLPSKLPADITVAQGKLTLKTDSAGALFLSKDGGRKWTTVKRVWKGKVSSLVLLPPPASSSAPAFQLTTDSGAVWVSRDGNKWYGAAAGSK